MTNANHLQDASMAVTKIAGSMLANVACVAPSMRKAMTQRELDKIAAMRVALTRYENELRAYAG